jgi:SAM-dependent methyltransferase
LISTPCSHAQNEIERILLQHPDVMEVRLVAEEGLAGQDYPVAYVEPHAERMKQAKSRIYLADRDKRIAQWRRAFDHVYRSGGDSNAPTFVGWTSNYTGKPIPETEMREWLDRTSERIMALSPGRVLEIGCGVGLLVQALAPACSAYCGTDLSAVAVARLREFAATRPELGHVRLLQREATNFDDLEPGSVDTVVLNSVAQYFPDIGYLRKVLGHAARLVASGGHIFIGDVRHLGLLPLFHGAVQLAKAPQDASARWLRRKVWLAIAQERELVIDPRFFLSLADSIPRIAGAEILLKRGPADNELTRYRYDVLLHVDEAKFSSPPPVVEWQAGDHAAADLLSRFDAQQLSALRILDVPNSRVARDLAAVRMLQSADDRELVGDLRTRVAAAAGTGIDPEDFWKLSDMPAHDVRVGWSPLSADGRFDVAIVDRKHRPDATLLQRAAIGSLDASDPAPATDPLAAAFMQQLGLELGNNLRERIAEPLLPATVLVVNQMPPGRPTGSPNIVPDVQPEHDARAARGPTIPEIV